MKFQCLTHGNVNKLKLQGYTVAHEPQVTAHEKDLEGITFIVEEPTDRDQITAQHISSNEAETYLEKFSNWDSEIADVVRNYYTSGLGVDEFQCPHNHTDQSITHIVDTVFIPDVTGDVVGSFTVYDTNLQISQVQNTGDVDTKTFYRKILEQATEQNINTITVYSSNTDGKLDGILTDLGFETNIIKIETPYSYKKLKATIAI